MLQAIDVAKFFLALDTDREIFGLNLITVTGIWSCTENDLPTIAWLDECVAVNVEDTEISEELQKHLERMAQTMKAKEAYDAG